MADAGQFRKVKSIIEADPARKVIVVSAAGKRFKDDQREVAQGYECGLALEKYADLHEGDVLESYIIEEYRD